MLFPGDVKGHCSAEPAESTRMPARKSRRADRAWHTRALLLLFLPSLLPMGACVTKGASSGSAPDSGNIDGSGSFGASGSGGGSSTGFCGGGSGGGSGGSYCPPFGDCASETSCPSPTGCGWCDCEGGEWVCYVGSQCAKDAGVPEGSCVIVVDVVCPSSAPSTGSPCDTSKNVQCTYPGDGGCVSGQLCSCGNVNDTTVWTCTTGICPTPPCPSVPPTPGTTCSLQSNLGVENCAYPTGECYCGTNGWFCQ